MRTNEIDMTQGPLAGKLLLFSVPLMFSNVLQVLFNLADVAVAGKFAGTIALGAVGSTTILITLTTGILLGLAGGINAVTALHVGAKDNEKVEACVHTAFIICMIAGLMLLAAGIFLTAPVLRLIGTKDELFGGASVYMKIYLLGSPALAVYNFGNAILSSVGDTKRSLRYLTAAGIINIILNLFFVIVLHLDVVGVALASIISQYISAFLMLRYLLTCHTEYGLYLKKIRPDRRIAGRILALGIPTAIQYTLFALANLFIQSAVNSFDHVVVEGNSAAANADNVIYDLMAAFYTASTSFIAQNLGAGKKDRILKTYFLTTLYAAVLAGVLGGLLVIFKVPFLSLFTDDSQVIAYGSTRLTIMGCSYFISAFMDNSTAAARGIGKTVMPTFNIILGSVVYRIIWVCTVFAYFHTLTSLYLVFTTAWIFSSVIGNIYLFISFRKLKV